MAQNLRHRLWLRRKRRTQKQVARTARPLLTVYRSSKHLYAQLVDPISGRTLTSLSTRSPALRDGLKSTKSREAATKLGEAIAKAALEREIKQVTFNRNGFVFHGRVKAIADGAREAGLSF